MGFPFVPTAEPEGTPNAFLTKTPAQALEDGDSADVPYLTGICKDESLFVLKSADYEPQWDDDLEFQVLSVILVLLGVESTFFNRAVFRKFYVFLQN